MELLHVNNLHVFKNNTMLLEDINFTVNKHDVFVILGPNGAGKTTLLKAILSLIDYQGEVIWKTKKISYLPPQETMIRQGLPPLTIEDFFSLKHIPHDDITPMLQAVGIEPDRMKQQFVTLSTGQFQRVLIAWALVNKPEILLFDEPTLGVDIGGEETIYSLLHKFWKEQNLTIILVTHDLQFVWEYTTNVLCLNKKVLCQGKPEQILSPETLKTLYGAGVKAYDHKHT